MADEDQDEVRRRFDPIVPFLIDPDDPRYAGVETGDRAAALRTLAAMLPGGQPPPEASQPNAGDAIAAVLTRVAQGQPTSAMAFQPQNQQLSPQPTENDPYRGYGPPPRVDIPAPPNLRDIPQPNLPDPRSSFQVFQNPLILLATLGSLFTRKHGLAAMGFATGAMEGFQQGDRDLYERRKSQFDEAMKATIDQNRTELEKYNVAWNRVGVENWNKELPRIWADLAAHDDQIGMAAARQGPEAFSHFLAQRESINRAAEMAQIKADIAAEAKYGQNTPQAREASTIVDGMESGDQPPTTTGLYGLAGFVRSEAARRGFNLAKAQLEWLGAQTQMRSLHGPQMTRYFALAQSVQSTIDRVLETSKNLKLGQYPIKNHADLIYLVQTKADSPEGKLAIQYLADIGTLKEEFANLAQGGGVPTEPAWAQANKLINEDFGVTALDTSLREVRRLIGYRVGAIQQQGSQGYSPAGKPVGAPGEGGESTGGIIRYDSEGNRVQ